jgi:nucleoid DNA-binding protein
MSKSHYANEQLVARVVASTGLTKREAQVAVLSTTKAIIEQLLEGREVGLRGLGTFCFRMVSGRKIPQRICQNGRVLATILLPPRPKLKFSVAASLTQDLRGVIPLEVRSPKKWSLDRKKNENDTNKHNEA